MDRSRRDITSTRAEFRRGVEAAFPGAVAGDGDRLRVERAPLTMTIALADGPPRRLGALSLATLHVDIAIVGGDAGDRAAMLAHMDRVMQRGGG